MKSLWQSVKWGLLELVRRPIYMVAMVAVPVFMGLFLIDLLSEGLPAKVPTAVVDMDKTDVSRKLIRALGDMKMIDVQQKLNSTAEAHDAMQRGEIYGYFVIPANFAKKALSGRNPQISYYYNYVYYIPATLAFKDYKMQSVLMSGALVSEIMNSAGIPDYVYKPKIQPYPVDAHALNNPMTNYDIYLSNSFLPCVLVLMIMIMTCYSLGNEIKYVRSQAWLKNSRGSIALAVAGKLLPQTVIFIILGVFLQSLCFGYNNFPMHCSLWKMLLAMVLLVLAAQSVALFIFSIIPNLRLALSGVSLIGILSFSLAGFSFPAEQMYGSMGIFSYILPIRYYFLIYVDQALNGIDMYYSRIYYAALLLFLLLPPTMMWNLKRAAVKQNYIP